jgi:hypothetical protein
VALSLYLDDCAYSHTLRTLLQQAGHTVVVPVDAGFGGGKDKAKDPQHFEHAVGAGLVLVTKNPADFLALHSAHHPGIIAIHQDNDRTRDMTPAEIVRAIGNREQAGALADAYVVLNQWRY